MNPSSLSFIEELSFGLFHNWNPDRPFMVLWAYVDESGKDNASPEFVMAGYVFKASEWKQAETAYRKLLWRYRIKKFHAVEMEHTKGEFKDWPRQRKDNLILDLQAIINRYAETGYVVICNKSLYDEYVIQAKKERARTDSIYAVCFRVISAYLISFSAHWRNGQPVNFIMEAGHHNAPDAVRVHQDYLKRWPEKERKCIGTLAFQAKDESALLGLADAAAYHSRRAGNALTAPTTGRPFDPTRLKGAAIVYSLREADLALLRQGRPPGFDPEYWKKN